MREVQDFVVDLGRDNVGVHLDTYSMNMEDNDIEGAYRCCASRLEYVHFSDTARFYPGAGNVDFKSHIRCLKEIDYQGFVTVEVKPFPSEAEAARRSINYMKALECVVDIENEAKKLR